MACLCCLAISISNQSKQGSVRVWKGRVCHAVPEQRKAGYSKPSRLQPPRTLILSGELIDELKWLAGVLKS